ncbi:MAG: GDP-mannose 4,6-dehydratase [Solirubrobacterales bacterium]|nr:GDP-mannose 4,6-dehydratase [Solirubrobacterales bacterium]
MAHLDLTGKSVFVTGGYGLLGSWLVRSLLDQGADVTVLRRDITSRSALVVSGDEVRCSVVSGDLCEPGLVERALGEYECELVFHLAAQTIVPVANKSPLGTFETNVRGTWTLLEACRLQEVSGVVVAASDKAYGNSDTLPYTEDMALRPLYPYDASKAAADLITRSYFHTWGLPVAVTRFANLYGGGDLNRSRLVPEAISAALSGRSPVIRSDGSPERDYLHVDDAVEAYLAIAAAVVDGKAAGLAINAGHGEPVSVLKVVSTICEQIGSDLVPDVRGDGPPKGEIPRQWVDPTLIRELTGWQASISLEEGIARTIAWYRDHPGSLPVGPPPRSS